ncbi:MAG: cysteine hydrolase, partial [Oscillospiraceae bacterium]
EFCIFQFATTLRAWLNERGEAGGEVIVPLDLIDSYDAPGHSALLYNLVYAAGMAESGVRLAAAIE